jgi:hypothetical protein
VRHGFHCSAAKCSSGVASFTLGRTGNEQPERGGPRIGNLTAPDDRTDGAARASGWRTNATFTTRRANCRGSAGDKCRFGSRTASCFELRTVERNGALDLDVGGQGII